MVQMPKIPKIPPKEELEFKEKEFMLSVYENFGKSKKIWFWILLAALVAWIPGQILLEKNLTSSFIAKISVPRVILNPYIARDLEIIQSEIIPVKSGIYSAYLQVLNPNPEISARNFSYELSMFASGGEILKKVSGESFILAGQSKFIVFPNISSDAPPASVKANLKNIKWTKYAPPINPVLEVLQVKSGVAAEGNFFVESLVRNPESYLIKRVELAVLLFDKQNKNIIAVNSTKFNDLTPGASRYFRVLWPNKFSDFGNAEIIPVMNLFEENFELQKAPPLPSR